MAEGVLAAQWLAIWAVNLRFFRVKPWLWSASAGFYDLRCVTEVSLNVHTVKWNLNTLLTY